MDGQELRHNPASVMDNIQKFLGVTPLFNYTQALRWGNRSGEDALSAQCGTNKQYLEEYFLSPTMRPARPEPDRVPSTALSLCVC